jgi:hypothetical protein
VNLVDQSSQGKIHVYLAPKPPELGVLPPPSFLVTPDVKELVEPLSLATGLTQEQSQLIQIISQTPLAGSDTILQLFRNVRSQYISQRHLSESDELSTDDYVTVMSLVPEVHILALQIFFRDGFDRLINLFGIKNEKVKNDLRRYLDLSLIQLKLPTSGSSAYDKKNISPKQPLPIASTAKYRQQFNAQTYLAADALENTLRQRKMSETMLDFFDRSYTDITPKFIASKIGKWSNSSAHDIINDKQAIEFISCTIASGTSFEQILTFLPTEFSAAQIQRAL